MRTVNDIIRLSDYNGLGRWQMWVNDQMNKLYKLAPVKHPIDVTVIQTEVISTNGQDWECQHTGASLEYVTVGADDALLVSVCDNCPAQLIGGEWVE